MKDNQPGMKTEHWGSKKHFLDVRIYLSFTLVLLLAAACSNNKNDQGAGAAGNTVITRTAGNDANAGPAWPVLALLKTGENPLWFELGDNGPVLIESPDSASLAPFTPWPYARFITGMAPWNGSIAMAVNRDGFLCLGPNNAASTGSAAAGAGVKDINLLDTLPESNADELALYRVADNALWSLYTTESFFTWQDKPAVLLYRNDFFADLNAPSPQPQVYVLDKASPVPVGADIPALENFPPGPSWEAEVLRRGKDGFWYYRMKQKGEVQNETAYFRAADLAGKGEKISFGEWRDSNQVESYKNAPAFLTAMLDNAASIDPASIGEIEVISPDFEGKRFFSFPGTAAGNEDSSTLYCFCRMPDQLAIAILSDGRGLYSSRSQLEALPFSLPALPEGFVYTGIALINRVLVASWEEQQEADIGAAGFMLVRR